MSHISKYDLKRGLKIPIKITEDLAYLCGVFAGDGSIGFRKSKNEYSLKVVGNPKDEQEFYSTVIAPKFKKVFGIMPNTRYHDTKTTYGFSIYSKAIYDYLVNFIGLPSGVKYNSLKIPQIFFEDEKLVVAFIRGVFDTDGCISFKKRANRTQNYPVINLTSKSANFTKQIADFLESIGLKLSVLYDYHAKDSRIKLSYSVKSLIFINGHNNLKLWMDKIGFYSPKHLNKIRGYGKFKG